MLNFSSFNITKDVIVEEGSNVKVTSLPKTSKLNIKYTDIVPKITKLKTEEARLIEPGHKIPTGQFQTVALHCEACKDVQGHAHKVEKRKLICLRCKTIKIY